MDKISKGRSSSDIQYSVTTDVGLSCFSLTLSSLSYQQLGCVCVWGSLLHRVTAQCRHQGQGTPPQSDTLTQGARLYLQGLGQPNKVPLYLFAGLQLSLKP